jgi:DNA-directed RNA polymerase specialized sigma24 family protein
MQNAAQPVERPGEAMNALARFDTPNVQVVETRFFRGLNVEEIPEVLKVSAATMMRDRTSAKAWLYREPGGGPGDGLRSLEAGR